MAPRILIVQSERSNAQTLAELFRKRGAEVSVTSTPEAVHLLLGEDESYVPALVVLDLHMPRDGWLTVFRQVQKRFPRSAVLFTTDQSSPNSVMRAKALGAQFFMRAPFTEAGLRPALKRMEIAHGSIGLNGSLRARLPQFSVPVRVKITFPYVFLAILIALATAYIVNRVASQSAEDRFVNQLVDTGRLAEDWMVQEEDRLLRSLRLVANTEGVAEAVVSDDAERLRELVLPVAINLGEEAIEVLDAQGSSVLALRHVAGGNIEEYNASRGDTLYQNWEFVRNVLAGRSDSRGDKYAGMVAVDSQPFFYVAGPLHDEDGEQVGAVLVGESAATLARRVRGDTLAQITIYNIGGELLASTLFSPQGESQALTPVQTADILANKDEESVIRSLSLASSSLNYRELLGPWEARSGQDLGVIGVALPESFLFYTGQSTVVQVFFLVVFAFTLVLVVGVAVSRHITRPLLRVVDASAEVADGNLDVKVRAQGNDEIAFLTRSFNSMVDELREGSLYRDLLGRTVSPQVRDQLRTTLASGELRLEGQDAIATILIADVHGFTTISEKEDPITVLNWLNELFSEWVPIVNAYGGVVNEFTGDGLFAFFGILPRPLQASESAYLACKAALEMLEAAERINARRQRRGDPRLRVGIGINTGPVTAGGLGAADRLHYTVIGDTVNTAQRIEDLAHEFDDESGVMVSKQTLIALWERREEFNLEAYGVYTVKGKQEKLLVYRLWPQGVDVQLDADKAKLLD